MERFRFLSSKNFLRKIISTLSLLLLFFSNYLVFIVARSAISTLQGYTELQHFNQLDSYIANVDPETNLNLGAIDKEDTQNVYDYLSDNFKYAFFTDGFIVPLPHTYSSEVSFAYLNEEYYRLTEQFELSQGEPLVFHYQLNNHTEIPVLIGSGLSETYPLGTTIKVDDPALQQQITLKVQGVLKPNAYRSNFYSLHVKQYFNFSVILPVNEDFINKSNVGLQLHGLFDIIVLQTSKNKIDKLKTIMQNNLGGIFNFYTQQENFEQFSDTYVHSLKTLALLIAIAIACFICVIVWRSQITVCMLRNDAAYHTSIGLRYMQFWKVFPIHCYGVLCCVNLICLFVIIAYFRYEAWMKKDVSLATFGLFGIIEMDWKALLITLFFDIIVGAIVLALIFWKVRKTPNSFPSDRNKYSCSH